MNEELTPVPDEPSRRAPLFGRVRESRRATLAAVIALALVAGVIAWAVVSQTGDSSNDNGTVATPVEPVALSASGLGTLARASGQPIYWAGPRKGYLYELTRTANRNVYVRYLPPGVNAGDKRTNYLIVATYPFPGAFEALQKVAGSGGVQIPGGGLALVDQKDPKSVHVAFPNVDYQVEVFDPSPARALAVATSGQVRLAG
jgi:hypothetical protein